MALVEEKANREKLLRNVKKEIKQLMEVSVSRKVIHEDNSCITSLCASVEGCLLHGLKSGFFFKKPTTLSLLTRLGKQFEPIAEIVRLCEEYERLYPGMPSPSLKNTKRERKFDPDQPLNFAPTFYKGSACYHFLWIRLALLNKSLVQIVEFLVSQQITSQFYLTYALCADPVDSAILCSLLVGPGCLEFTRLKICDNMWMDAHADELVQRHRMQGTSNHGISFDHSQYSNSQYQVLSHTRSLKGTSSHPGNKRVALVNNHKSRSSTICSPKLRLGYSASVIAKRKASISALEDINNSSRLNFSTCDSSVSQSPSQSQSTPLSCKILKQSSNSTQHSKFTQSTNSARDYVESLHQNTKSQLIYGKNNVVVKQKDRDLVGYLSLHAVPPCDLVLKWTPNQLMNGEAKVGFWEMALQLDFSTVVYIHCHRGQMVLVGCDGVQYPPLLTTPNALRQLLVSVEQGLMPNGRLEPPLKANADMIEMEEHSVFRIVTGNTNVAFAAIKDDKKRSDSPSIDTNNLGMSLNTLKKSKNLKLGSFFSSDSSTSLDRTPSTSTTESRISQSSLILDCSNAFLFSERLDLSPIDKLIPVTPKLKAPTVRGSLKKLCETMSKQILTRAFYGWLAHHRNLKTVGRHLTGLVTGSPSIDTLQLPSSDSYMFRCLTALEEATSETVINQQELCINCYIENGRALDAQLWKQIINTGVSSKIETLLYKLVYHQGVDHAIRKQVWPFLLEHYKFESTLYERQAQENAAKTEYQRLVSEWKPFEEFINLREKKIVAASLLAKKVQGEKKQQPLKLSKNLSNDSLMIDSACCLNDDNESKDYSGVSEYEKKTGENLITKSQQEDSLMMNNDVFIESFVDQISSPISMMERTKNLLNKLLLQKPGSLPDNPDSPTARITDTEISIARTPLQSKISILDSSLLSTDGGDLDEDLLKLIAKYVVNKAVSGAVDICHTKNSQRSRIFLNDGKLVNTFALNIHRIDKDVTRCDRNYCFFTENENLQKLKNIVYTYTWENLDVGYIQGMCDLVAPLLVVFNDESLTYACFKKLMERMTENFPQSTGMDRNFSSMRLLIQILDADLYEHMYKRGDFTHFYFSYRWFLLDFKRELLYADVFNVWETIWAAKPIISKHFYLFIALALVETYRDIIIENNMDFTDIIKFFNEMAEKHKTKEVLDLARTLVIQLQKLIKNKETDEF